MSDISGNDSNKDVSFIPNEYEGDYLESLRGDENEISQYETLLSSLTDYSDVLENIQTILIFQCTLLIAIGCIIAWVCGRDK